MTVVQIHPDADSMATHLKVGADHFVEAYTEYLEPESTQQIYGPSPRSWLRRSRL
ncbi:hypothetical protein [Actinokineospora sp.]|uniref:hypothetical protein n=1 Tax=Actinokineospora sp. TaxID=1872133 RepID=UPI003D6ADBB5